MLADPWPLTPDPWRGRGAFRSREKPDREDRWTRRK